LTDRLEVKLTPESQKLVANLDKVGKISLFQTFTQIGVSYRKEVDAIFQRQQPRGVDLQWVPLNPVYEAWKKSNYPESKGILRRTDRLYNSMVNPAHEENITDIGFTSAAYGTRVPYAGFHDSTDDQSRTHPPMRNFSIPGEKSIEGMLKSLESAFVQSFEINGYQVERVFA